MEKRILSLLLAFCFVLPCAILLSACGPQSDKPTDIPANFENMTFTPTYDDAGAYENTCLIDHDFAELLGDATLEGEVTYQRLLEHCFDHNLIDWEEFGVPQQSTMQGLKAAIHFELPNIESFGSITFGSQEEKTLTCGKVTYDLQQNDEKYISFNIYNHGAEQIEENVIGSFYAYDYGGWTKDGYLYKEPKAYLYIGGTDFVSSCSVTLPLTVVNSYEVKESLSILFPLFWTIAK